MDCRQIRKTQRKIKHCEGILLKYENIKPSSVPTNVIFVGNGGLGCGIYRELLIDIFSFYGPLQNIVMLPGKPYAFVVYKCKDDAINGMNAINGQYLTSGYTFYLSYIHDSDLPQESHCMDLWPSGLILLEDFVSEDQEKELLSVINFKETEDGVTLKHRKVKHYGYEFIYGKNNIDKKKSLDLKIPDECYPHLQKLVHDGYIPRIPDQLTVNYYLPGHGIPPHIDTHSAFEDGIISLSLGSQLFTYSIDATPKYKGSYIFVLNKLSIPGIPKRLNVLYFLAYWNKVGNVNWKNVQNKIVMDFYHPTRKCAPVVLPRRSVLIMTGESRYLWKHGITPRKTDIIPVKNDEGYSLTLFNRSPRTSLTFRLIREGECSCSYIDQCDSQLKSKSTDLVDEKEAKELERKYVNQVYENIADHFSDTRYKPWPKVSSFLSTIPAGSIILDIGCGNGKNMGLSHHCFEIGCDASTKLSEVCSSRNIEVLTADCLKLPFRNNCADVVICIAVIHHLSTKARRAKAINEIMRVLRFGGRALIYVWAFEQERPEGPSNYLKSSKQTFEKKGENGIILSTEVELNECTNSPRTIKMPVHKNRTNFMQQDMLVPWKEKKSTSQPATTDSANAIHHRYYHVFAEGELETLVTENKGYILTSYYDKGNWCVLFEK